MHYVVFPDYRAENHKTMTGRIHAACPDAVAVGALNGPQEAELTPHAGNGTGWERIITPPGFNAAVHGGLRCALAAGATKVVRLDTAEHDVQLLPEAFARLDRTGMVIFDLVFDEDTLVAGTPDERLNLVDMPGLLSSATGGRLALSGAHGYMAFTREVLDPSLAVVERALAHVDGSVTWGLDTAVALAAVNLGFEFEVIGVKATELRNRPEAKIDTQLRHTEMWIDALSKVS